MQNPPSGESMPTVLAFVYAFLGILLSLIIPILRKLAVPEPAGAKDMNRPSWFVRHWPDIKPYVLMSVLSLALSIVTVAIAMSQAMPIQRWYQAFLLGYFFDSTIQKFKS